MKTVSHRAMLESLENRRLYSAIGAATKTIYEIAGDSFTADLGEAKAYSPIITPARRTSVKIAAYTTTFTFSATIHWGDGKTSAGTAVENSDGTYDIDGKHTYAKAGTYHIAVFVTRAPSGPGPQPQFIELFNSLHDRAIVSSAS